MARFDECRQFPNELQQDEEIVVDRNGLVRAAQELLQGQLGVVPKQEQARMDRKESAVARSNTASAAFQYTSA
jgi:hypothetical protein